MKLHHQSWDNLKHIFSLDERRQVELCFLFSVEIRMLLARDGARKFESLYRVSFCRHRLKVTHKGEVQDSLSNQYLRKVSTLMNLTPATFVEVPMAGVFASQHPCHESHQLRSTTTTTTTTTTPLLSCRVDLTGGSYTNSFTYRRLNTYL